MSGGSLDYGFQNINRLAELIAEFDLGENNRSDETKLNIEALRRHLVRVSDAVHALEWYLSGDTGEDDFNQAFDKFVFETRDDPAFKEYSDD